MRYSQYLIMGIKQGLAIRTILLMWLLSKPIAIMVHIIVWTTIYGYAGAEVIRGFNLEQIIGYGIFITLSYPIIWASVDNNLRSKIHSGDIARKMLEPVNYSISEFFFFMGVHVIDLIVQVIPALLVAVIFFGFKQFGAIFTIIACLSVILSFIINYWFSFIWGLMFFKLESVSGTLNWVKNFLIELFAGVYLPITFFPEALASALKYLPFQYIFYAPARIFVGGYAIEELPFIIMMQVFWGIALYFSAKTLFKQAMKSYSGAMA